MSNKLTIVVYYKIVLNLGCYIITMYLSNETFLKLTTQMSYNEISPNKNSRSES